MRYYVLLAESQLIGGHTQYYVLCGLGVPSLRSLWGVVRNRQLYVLRMYRKNCISFNFSFLFFNNLTTCRKKKLHVFTPKKKLLFFLNKLHNLLQKKLHALAAKKIHA